MTRTSFSLFDTASGLNTSFSKDYDSAGEGIRLDTIQVNDFQQMVDYGEFSSPRTVILRLLDGDNLRVGTAPGGSSPSTSYSLLLSGKDDFMVFALPPGTPPNIFFNSVGTSQVLVVITSN
jgi:hypothetical protein